ncbi:MULTISPECIES: hypothetical protein [Cohnella]|uniref:hypothetical protein n=1 Tax=Cohnella TaxID=329857 RepID=UPI001593E226|nr:MULTISPECIES: hypothetical protein [Cohnella]MBN2983734.1 hypothetical protein [Cohnella algarum]
MKNKKKKKPSQASSGQIGRRIDSQFNELELLDELYKKTKEPAGKENQSSLSPQQNDEP